MTRPVCLTKPCMRSQPFRPRDSLLASWQVEDLWSQNTTDPLAARPMHGHQLACSNHSRGRGKPEGGFVYSVKLFQVPTCLCSSTLVLSPCAQGSDGRMLLEVSPANPRQLAMFQLLGINTFSTQHLSCQRVLSGNTLPKAAVPWRDKPGITAPLTREHKSLQFAMH